MCPDVVSFSTAAAAVAATDEWPMALQLFEEMVQQEVRGSLVWDAGYMKHYEAMFDIEIYPNHHLNIRISLIIQVAWKCQCPAGNCPVCLNHLHTNVKCVIIVKQTDLYIVYNIWSGNSSNLMCVYVGEEIFAWIGYSSKTESETC